MGYGMANLEQIVVVQISDLHFGYRRRPNLDWSDGRVPHDRNLCIGLGNALEQVRVDLELADDEKLNFLVTGDVTSGGAGTEFELANAFLHEEIGSASGASFGLGI